MKTQRLLVVLTVVNLAILISTLAPLRPAAAQGAPPVLRGRPSVKISASEEAAGLSFAGPSNTSDTYVILEAKGTNSLLKLRNENGREQVVKP
jgi:hypothetical protein